MICVRSPTNHWAPKDSLVRCTYHHHQAPKAHLLPLYNCNFNVIAFVHAGIFNDLGSGSNCDVTIIRKNGEVR
jgi:hypothetical protein